MARSKESYQLAAANANVTKWSKAISKVNDGKPIFEVLSIDESVWKDTPADEKLKLINEWKDGKDIKLPRNKKTQKEFDIKTLAFQLINPNATPEQKELASKHLSLAMSYDDAEKALNEAKKALDEAKENYEKAKANFKLAKGEIEKSNNE